MNRPDRRLLIALFLICGLAASASAQTGSRLIDAVKRLDTAAVRSLLIAHADVKATDADGSTADAVVAYLTTAAASVNTRAQVCVSSSLPRGSSASGLEQYGQPSGQRCVSSARRPRGL